MYVYTHIYIIYIRMYTHVYTYLHIICIPYAIHNNNNYIYIMASIYNDICVYTHIYIYTYNDTHTYI